MSSARILGRIIAGAAGGAFNGFACASVGAKVLDDAGYADYNVTEMMQVGATGGAVIGAGVGLIQGVYKEAELKMPVLESLALLGSLGLPSASAVLGNVMLKTIANMPLDKTAAAAAVGGGIFAGAGVSVAALACVIGGFCYLCCDVPVNDMVPTAMQNRV